MTKYSVKYAQNYGIFKEVALFSEWIPEVVLINFCDDLSNEIDNCTAVEAVDLETGAIVYGFYADEDTGGTVYEVYSDEEDPVIYGIYGKEPEDEPEPEDEGLEFDNCDDDCGFDPYLGCYTDDV